MNSTVTATLAGQIVMEGFLRLRDRLAAGEPLGIDAATAYGVGKKGNELTTADLQDPNNPYNLRIILEESKVPVLVDAGVGTASDATIAMELGCEAVLMNSAIAEAQNPVLMARAMQHAVEAGRLAYLAGRMPKKLYASASSPLTGLIN